MARRQEHAHRRATSLSPLENYTADLRPRYFVYHSMMAREAAREGGETEVLVVQGADLAVRRFALTVVSGPDVRRHVVSSGTELVIGTAEGNHLVLTDTTVSRIH